MKLALQMLLLLLMLMLMLMLPLQMLVLMLMLAPPPPSLPPARNFPKAALFGLMAATPVVLVVCAQ